jgi:hypothetical protein
MIPGLTRTYPTHITQAGPGHGTVYVWDVRLSAVADENYEAMCGCGYPASGEGPCKHFYKALGPARCDWRDFQKPWSTPDAWEQQVGPLWARISAQEILEATESLRQAGDLLLLFQPSLNLRSKGRAKRAVAKTTEKRFSSFIEDLKQGARTLDAEALSAAAASGSDAHNQGGKGTRKKCSGCAEYGHSLPDCPAAAQVLAQLTDDAEPQPPPGKKRASDALPSGKLTAAVMPGSRGARQEQEKQKEEQAPLWKRFHDAAGVRNTVRGNGSCWLSAPAGAVDALDHGRPCPVGTRDTELEPSPQDLRRVEALLTRVKLEVLNELYLVTANRNAGMYDLMRRLMMKEVWPGANGGDTTHGAELDTPSGLGDFGGSCLEMCALARVLERTIIVVAHTAVKKGIYAQDSDFAFVSAGKTVSRAYKNISLESAVAHLEGDEPPIVLEFNEGESHYAYWLADDAVQCEWLAKAKKLKKSTPPPLTHNHTTTQTHTHPE